MTDMYIAYASMLVATAGLGFAAGRWCYPQSGQTVMLLVTLALTASVGFMLHLAGQLVFARWVSDSAAIVWTNLTPVFIGLASGWVCRLPSIPTKRRALMSLALACGSLLSLFWPSLAVALRPPPQPTQSRIQAGVVMQSGWATCSPAAAATLLLQSGIETTEQEMIPLCLTDSSGTPSLGLYRGVKLMAERHGRQVAVIDWTIEELMNNSHWPLLLTVELPEYGVTDPRYQEQWGWIPGMGHSVVALQKTDDGQLLVGDPSTGPELWTAADLEVLWHGEGLQLNPAE